MIWPRLLGADEERIGRRQGVASDTIEILTNLLFSAFHMQPYLLT